ncbi:MAG: MurR/RpiR family transcriptional regulator [Candidatus Parcubacteria bacterium]|nr:MurR/RpiR family transcriptional regulator [Burkholderiales bacterium]
MPAARSFEQLKGELSLAYPGLSRQLQSIATYALENPQDMALDTVARLAKGIGVQPSAMVRFAQALGYGGFSDLQSVFRTRLVERSNNHPGMRNYRQRIEAFRAGHERSGPGGVLGQFVTDGIASLEQLHEHVSPDDLAAAVKELAGARTIYVLGHRRSFPVAFYLSYALTQLELHAPLLDSVGGMLREPARLIGPKDALLVVSFKNYTPEVIEIAKDCHARKVPVIAITDNALSPLARASRICFQIEEKTSTPFRMLVAPICLAQALVVAVGEQLG